MYILDQNAERMAKIKGIMLIKGLLVKLWHRCMFAADCNKGKTIVRR